MQSLWEIASSLQPGRFAGFARSLLESEEFRNLFPDVEKLYSVRHDFRHGHFGESVLEHTLRVVERIESMIKKPEPELRIAGLFHDIGKIYTVAVQGDRISFPKHEEVGAVKVREILTRIGLEPSKVETIVLLVRLHMYPHMLYASGLSPREIASKVLSRLNNNVELARKLLMLAIADTEDVKEMETLYKAIEEVEKIVKEQSKPKPLLSGSEIMKIYGLKPSPEVGRLKQLLYEIQVKHNISSKEKLIEIACREYGICPSNDIYVKA